MQNKQYNFDITTTTLSTVSDITENENISKSPDLDNISFSYSFNTPPASPILNEKSPINTKTNTINTASMPPLQEIPERDKLHPKSTKTTIITNALRNIKKNKNKMNLDENIDENKEGTEDDDLRNRSRSRSRARTNNNNNNPPKSKSKNRGRNRGKAKKR